MAVLAQGCRLRAVGIWRHLNGDRSWLPLLSDPLFRFVLFSLSLSLSLSFSQWLDSNPGAEEDDYVAKLKEVEAVANPIIAR